MIAADFTIETRITFDEDGNRMTKKVKVGTFICPTCKAKAHVDLSAFPDGIKCITCPEQMQRARGFAAMDTAAVASIASRGGKEAHRVGSAHKFTSEEARAAGTKGGNAPHKSRGGRRKSPDVDT